MIDLDSITNENKNENTKKNDNLFQIIRTVF